MYDHTVLNIMVQRGTMGKLLGIEGDMVHGFGLYNDTWFQ